MQARSRRGASRACVHTPSGSMLTAMALNKLVRAPLRSKPAQIKDIVTDIMIALTSSQLARWALAEPKTKIGLAVGRKLAESAGRRGSANTQAAVSSGIRRVSTKSQAANGVERGQRRASAKSQTATRVQISTQYSGLANGAGRERPAVNFSRWVQSNSVELGGITPRTVWLVWLNKVERRALVSVWR